ncbi:MAG: hypothetical protein ABL931_04770 [Usitatibacteraceae bacterium]
MNRLLIALASACFAVTACHAEAVFKCDRDEGVVYQATTCERVAQESAPRVPAAFTEPRTAAPAIAETESATMLSAPTLRPAILTPTRSKIQPGTSELWVLNNRRWGKPQHISRNREARAWHEHWTYTTGPNSGVRLHFINGSLADVEDTEQPAATPPALNLILATASGEH